MTGIFKKKILHLLSRRDYKPVKLAAIKRLLGVADGQYEDFKVAFEQLRRQGRVVIGTNSLIVLPSMSGRITGTFRANPKGFGFVVPLEPNSHGDLFIGPGDTSDAMTGDTVVAKAVKKGVRNGQMRYSGVIVEILERGQNRFVGVLKKNAAGWVVQPDGKEFFGLVAVEDVTAKQARENDKVIVEIISYPSEESPACGVIVEVLGKAGSCDSETKSIIAQHHLAGEFEQDCIEQARQVAHGFSPDSVSSRDDITKEVVITIDPADAKDFDDAISLSRDADGNWVLGVHIADVSSFIPMGSPLDVEAKERGNSVYLPGTVIPMLPEILSNGICSLQPGRKRFVKSVYITYDPNGSILATDLANSVICSTARLTYTEADKILRGKAQGFEGQVVALLKDTETLARAIDKRRIKNGMLKLQLPETELVMDDSGQVIDAHPADNSYPHTIIEMFMVEANDAVASLLDRFSVPFMRRIHPEPDPVSVKNLGRFVKLCGMKVPRRLDRTAIQNLLAAVQGTSYSYAINMHILRSLQKAEYAPLNIGHFALASRHYCHFTSPIRRYADLMVHRLLGCYLEHRLNMIGLEEVLPETELTEIGSHISFTERRAENAEKELKTVLILQMLSGRIGDEMDCVVSGLTNFGLFVQCLKFGIEGLIGLDDLGMDQWRYSERSEAILGMHSGKSIHLGQPIRVRIVSVNVPARQLNVVPAKPLTGPGRQNTAAKPRKNPKQKPRRKPDRKR